MSHIQCYSKLQIKKFVSAVFLLASFASAVGTVAVLEIVPAEGVELKVLESRHLTDELRTKAREALPQGGYTILTRDNILSLLPPDSEEAQCLAESCAVEIGRAIGAEYITQGFVGEFSGMLTLTVELYESITGNLLGSFVTESRDVMGLLNTIREKAPDLFARIANQKPAASLAKDIDAVLDNSKPAEKKIDPQVGGVEKKGGNSFWVALGLDLVGAGLVAYGFVKNSEAKDLHSDYRALPKGLDQDVYRDTWKKSDDASGMRNALYVAGGLVLATGIGVHIWF
ncbi:MAG: hypothetical protein FWB90_09130 [Fibromonadales bacterium]|nr:hypothetical protein [Fibromonadales bacterium]